MSDINNTPASAYDEPIECGKVRKCGWKGMHSDLVGVPHKKWANAQQLVCPKCGCDSYYRRALAASDSDGGKDAKP